MKEEEYQYPGHELTPPEIKTETTESDENEHHEEAGFTAYKKQNAMITFIKNNKKMVSIITIIILVLITFHFMQGQTKPKVIYKTRPAPTVQQPNVALQEQLQALQNAEQNDNASIESVQNQMNDLNQTLNKTNASNQELGNALIALAEELKQLKQQLAAHQPVNIVKTGLPKPELVFHLRAIIPGRAWIISNENLSESIRVGDHVPNYGTVEAILDGQGIVKTSSGKIIRYGDNDA